MRCRHELFLLLHIEREFKYVQFFSEVAVKYLKTSFLFVWGFYQFSLNSMKSRKYEQENS